MFENCKFTFHSFNSEWRIQCNSPWTDGLDRLGTLVCRLFLCLKSTADGRPWIASPDGPSRCIHRDTSSWSGKGPMPY